ncbi:MAG: hypothetical protein HYV75_10580 [Opitutae bacterium]|nr:hypothetical protein [Opitutae bacterium]
MPALRVEVVEELAVFRRETLDPWLPAIRAARTSGEPLENEYFKVMRGSRVEPPSGATDGERVIVALAPLQLQTRKGPVALARGEVVVLPFDDASDTPDAPFYEVLVKPGRPPSGFPGPYHEPGGNRVVHTGPRFRIFQERLNPGETRPVHSHDYRTVIPLNATKLEYWPARRPDGPPDGTHVEVPDTVRFGQPVTHVIRNAGEQPLFNIVIELERPR